MSVLSSIACFHALPAAALATLERGGFGVDPHDGAEIFPQGDPANAIYAIISGDGHVRIGSSTADAKSLMVEQFQPGDIFGELGVIDAGTRSASAMAVGHVRLWRIPAAVFMEVLNTTPEFGVALARMLTARLRRTYTLLQDATFATVEARLARQLIYLADLGGRMTEHGVRVPGRFRQVELANLLGTTSRSIISTLNAWREKGVVTYDTRSAQLTIRDTAVLRDLAGG